jgi:hypothetical protein
MCGKPGKGRHGTSDISASTGRYDFIFDTWLWHGDLYHVSPFQVYRTSTSCCVIVIFILANIKSVNNYDEIKKKCINI